MAEMKLDDTLIMDQVSEALTPNPDDAALRVAHYDLKREIGRGALSVVYEAEDTHTGQEVALKLLTLSSSLTPLEAEALIARFEREARTAARLSHPNIVHIHEVGSEQGTHFLAMEYLKGQTLRKRMKEKMLTPTEAFPILTQLAGALDAVHKAGIVHRDVKPTNIILLPNGTAKLLDFGIARSSRETIITHRGMIVGSPSYMAPEQIKGEAGTKATDIWALGVLSYEMLTGRLPFTGQNIGGVMFQIMHESPALAPDLPPAVQKVLLRTLDKRPSQRYSTAGALVQALKLAYPKQVPAAPEQKAAASPKPAAVLKPVKLPKMIKLPKPAASFSLPGPKWLPEATLLGLFLLGFSGAYLARLHSDSPTQKAAASVTAAQSLGQTPAPISVQASAPPPVPPAPQPLADGSDVPARPGAASTPDTAHTVAQSAPAVSASPKQEPQNHQAALLGTQALPVTQKAPVVQAKQAAAPMRPLHAAQTIAAVPAQPHRLSVVASPAAPRQAPVPAASVPHSAASPASSSAPPQVASRHFAVPAAAQQPVSRADRPEPEQTAARAAPARTPAQPVPTPSVDQAVTLPAEGGSYDPEADARRRKSAWSQEGSAAQP